ncbi:MAG: zinc-dependent metalloproteinase lipoprotein [Prevotella sp.]|jgi:zinc-dependent metalloproteinase lipoprotein
MKKYSIVAFMLISVMLMACGGDDGLTTPKQTTSDSQDGDDTTLTIDSTYVYQLPVIFHVLYQDKNDASQYIKAMRLKNILQYVNQIYRGGIYGESANTHLEFVLAKKDESGQNLSTPGVEYVHYTGDYPIDEEQFMSSSDNTKYIWDPNEYINVMLYHFKDRADGEVLGISHMPFTTKGSNQLKGLEAMEAQYISKSRLGFPLCSSINSIYAGQSDQGGYYQSDRYTASDHQAKYLVASDIVVTLAHELGHYLGLFHIFTEDMATTQEAEIFNAVDSCADTDYCEDTPSYNRAEYNGYLASYYISTPIEQQDPWDVLKRYSCDASEFYSANIMDYAITLGYKISPDQKARIRNVLYYSPLIPGPKLNKVNKRTRAGSESEEGPIIRPRIIREQLIHQYKH